MAKAGQTTESSTKKQKQHKTEFFFFKKKTARTTEKEPAHAEASCTNSSTNSTNWQRKQLQQQHKHEKTTAKAAQTTGEAMQNIWSEVARVGLGFSTDSDPKAAAKAAAETRGRSSHWRLLVELRWCFRFFLRYWQILRQLVRKFLRGQREAPSTVKLLLTFWKVKSGMGGVQRSATQKAAAKAAEKQQQQSNINNSKPQKLQQKQHEQQEKQHTTRKASIKQQQKMANTAQKATKAVKTFWKVKRQGCVFTQQQEQGGTNAERQRQNN